MRVFFTYIYSNDDTYIYGERTNSGWPLTFSLPAGRTIARNMLKEGDLVFGVISSNPGHGVTVPEKFKGRVVVVWQMTRQSSLLTDYDLDLNEFDLQWPYALQPIRMWEIFEPPLFRELDGYDNETHTLRSVSSIEDVNEVLGHSLIGLLETQGTEIELAKFKFPAMQQRNAQLRQRHPFRIEGYSVAPPEEGQVNYIYIATLGKGGKVLKIGHAVDPNVRIEAFNQYRISTEPQWTLEVSEPRGTVQDAIKAEAALGDIFSKYRTEHHNSEIMLALAQSTFIQNWRH